MTTTHDEQLAKIFGDAEGLGYLDPKYGPVMHDQVMSLYIDMMLELAAAQHEIEALKAQRDATRIYLGVALSDEEDADGNDSPEALLRKEVKRIFNEIGPDKKIQCIKELRSSIIASQAWDDLGNEPRYDAMQPNGRSRSLGLKEAKDIIDMACSGTLYLGQGRKSVPL